MVGDYLIESECDVGHTASVAIHGHSRDVAYAVARTLDDRCRWPRGEGDCARRVSHVVTDLGPPPSARGVPPTSPATPKRTITKPSMSAVMVPSKRPPVLIVDDSADGEESTEPPPPTTSET